MTEKAFGSFKLYLCYFTECKLHDIPSEIGYSILKPNIEQCLKCVVITQIFYHII